MTVFAAADGQQMTALYMLEHGRTTSAGFDVTTHRTETGRILLAATRELGWTGRGLFSDGLLDPYIVWRHLRFARFKIAVRDAILAALDDVVARVGQVLNFEATVTIPGLIQIEDLDQAETDLQTGRRPLQELLELGP